MTSKSFLTVFYEVVKQFHFYKALHWFAVFCKNSQDKPPSIFVFHACFQCTHIVHLRMLSMRIDMLCYFQKLRNLCWHWAGLSIYAYYGQIRTAPEWYQWICLYLAIGFFFDLEFLKEEFKGNCNALSAKIYLITNGLGGNAAFLADFFIGLAELLTKSTWLQPYACKPNPGLSTGTTLGPI